MKTDMYPFLLEPVFKDYIWGGSKLKSVFGKGTHTTRTAESWELSCHDDGLSVISNGKYRGMTLREFVEKNNSALGKNCQKFDRFPIIIKLIDAASDLSVQVHPTDDYARSFELDWGKSELWYVIDCKENAEIIYGFARETNAAEIKRRIENDTLIEAVKKIPVRKGDAFFIPAGTLHALGEGILIAEIQQNSNVTYRVCDYNRTDAAGKTRELHIDKALDVLSFETSCHSAALNGTVGQDGFSETLLYRSDYFKTVKFQIDREVKLNTSSDSFSALLFTDGEGDVDGVRFKKGDCFFIPAGYGDFSVAGKSEMLMTEID